MCETVWFPQLGLLFTLLGDAGLTDICTSKHTDRWELKIKPHSHEKETFLCTDFGIHKTLISNTEGLVDRDLLRIREEQEEKQKRETDAQAKTKRAEDRSSLSSSWNEKWL